MRIVLIVATLLLSGCAGTNWHAVANGLNQHTAQAYNQNPGLPATYTPAVEPVYTPIEPYNWQ